MEVNRKELLEVLDKVRPGVDTKGVMESMSYFLFSGTDIVTCNYKISIHHPFETYFSLLVKANDLYKLLSKLSSDFVTLIAEDTKLIIKNKTVKAELPTIQDNNLSERIEFIHKSLENAKWKQLPENFCDGISICVPFASTQEYEQTLSCVYVNGNACVSSDNKRIAYVALKNPVDSMFITASEIKKLVVTQPVEYTISDNLLHFKNENGCIFSIQKINGGFPDIQSFLDFEGTKINLPQDILEGIDIASILADYDNPSVSIKVSENTIFISTESESGTVKYKSETDYDGDDISFKINPLFLKQMIEQTKQNNRSLPQIIVNETAARLETEDKSLIIVSALMRS